MIKNLHSFKVILVATIILLLLPASSFSQWINEIHYDNNSTDVGEGIEIAGPAGTDLSCYQLVLYNGGTGAIYNTTALIGIIGDEGCGFGALNFAISGIQNGNPDGIALESLGGGGCPAAGLIQFLSYGGAFAGVGGIADGILSTDIGVTEGAGTPVGNSLQVTGSGNTSGAFSWQTDAPATIGSLNVGQSITPCVVPNTITTGAITSAPFTVDCAGPTTGAGSVDFTSTGTFNGPNIYTAELSDASGSFASPIAVGTLASTANSGTIAITIPANSPTGTGYLIRVVSDDPSSIGSNSAVFSITQSGSCVGLIINEWSNGPSGLPGGGNQEYYEFVVAGICGTLADIRGYILDDNNGTFTTPASYAGTPSGIAPGHFRFSNAAQWASIPVGSLIVVYNADDVNPLLPASDPTDANNDSLYVVPHDNALFERCTAWPQSTSPDSLYTPCAYATAPLVGWGPLSLRNSGDAIQVRLPNGDYYHGVSYGGAEMSGGPHNLKLFSGSGSEMCGWFSDGDFFSAANWTSGAIAGNETPGVANNAANAAWLIAMRDPAAPVCPFVLLPVELALFSGEKMSYGNELKWQTASETNSDYFTLESSIDGKNWEVITSSASAGNTSTLSSYSFIDNRYQPTVNYYRLSQTDFDGATKVYNDFVAIDNTPGNSNIVRIINLLGQEIDKNQPGIQIHIYDDGTSKKLYKD